MTVDDEELAAPLRFKAEAFADASTAELEHDARVTPQTAASDSPDLSAAQRVLGQVLADGVGRSAKLFSA
jgi:hypothetical protein